MSDGQTTEMQPTLSPPEPASETRPQRRGPSVLQLAVVTAILGVGITVTALTSKVTQTSEPGVRLVDGRPFLPEKAGNWTGDELRGLTEVERKLLPADTEGGRRIYRDTAGNEVYCSIVVAGREVTSIHRPELCLPGQGWKIESKSTEPIETPAAAGGRLTVTRMNATFAVNLPDGKAVRSRDVFIYWFVGKDRVTPYHWQRILWTTLDRVLYNRNHRWAYILIDARVKPGADPARGDSEAMQLIRRFVQDMYPVLASG